MDALQRFLRSPAGKIAAGCFIALALVWTYFAVADSFGPGSAAAQSRDRIYICSETGKSFSHELQLGETTPIESPHSGKKTGYPAELCFWTADGKPKSDPTPVLLNDRINKPGPTFCPDCGRLVVSLNPPAEAGATPPMTKEQYRLSKEKK